MKQSREFFWTLAFLLCLTLMIVADLRSWWALLLMSVFSVVFLGIAHGTTPVRLVCCGVLAGALLESLTLWMILKSADENAAPMPQRIYPFTFLYERIWPTWIDDVQGQFVDFGLNNALRAHGAGAATSGILFGIVSLLVWYGLGGRYVGERIAERYLSTVDWICEKWAIQPLERRQSIRMGSGIFYGLVVAVMIAGSWWRWLGPAAALAAAGAIFALLTVIALLDARRSILK